MQSALEQSGGSHTTVDGQALAGQPRAFIAGEVERPVSDVDRFPEPPDRMHSFPTGAERGRVGRAFEDFNIQRRFHGSRRDAVYSDALTRVLSRHLPGKAENRSFAGGVMRVAWKSQNALY